MQRSGCGWPRLESRSGERRRRLGGFRDRHAIDEDERVAVQGRDAGAGGDDSGEVERVGGGDAHGLAGARTAAHGPKRVDGLRQRVLLADEAGDEAAAAQDAARLHAAQRAHDVAPGDGERLAGDDVAEDDAVAQQQLRRDALGQLVGRGRLRGEAADYRPAPLREAAVAPCGAARVPAGGAGAR